MDYQGSRGTGVTGNDGSSSGPGQAVQDIAQQAQAKTGEVLDQAQQKAGQVMSNVQEQAKGQIAGQKDKAAESLTSVAQALRKTGDELNSQEQQVPVGQYITKAADQIERVSTFLRERDLNDMTWEVERFARRQPALFLGAAFGLGMLAARFLKSSSQAAQAGQGGYGQAGQGGYGHYGPYGQQGSNIYGGGSQWSGGGSSYDTNPVYRVPATEASMSGGSMGSSGYSGGGGSMSGSGYSGGGGSMSGIGSRVTPVDASVHTQGGSAPDTGHLSDYGYQSQNDLSVSGDGDGTTRNGDGGDNTSTFSPYLGS